jgi:hypothetical protein
MRGRTGDWKRGRTGDWERGRLIKRKWGEEEISLLDAPFSWLIYHVYNFPNNIFIIIE